ncbi:MAG: hypothetical protein ACKVTZ_17775 [Bacteroidia bacterium]
MFFLKKISLLVAFGIISSALWAQNLTLSPYSRYGIGDIFLYNSTRNAGMGGIGVASASVFTANRLNPASYTDIRRTTLDISGFAQFSHLRTKTDTATQNTVGFRDLSFIFPTNKRSVLALGFAPYSAAGYTIQDNLNLYVDKDTIPAYVEYTANGGLNQAYIGYATSFLKRKQLRVGANAYYSFGSLNREATSVIGNLASNLIKVKESAVLSGAGVHLGVQYRDTLFHRVQKNDSTPILYSVGLISDINFNLNATRNKFLSSVGVATSLAVVDTLQYQYKGKVALPNKYGIGFEISSPNHWAIGTDVIYQNWKTFQFLDDTLGASNKIQIGNDFRWALGGEWTPKWDGDNYFQRVTYRTGAYYHHTYLAYDEKNINDLGLSLGVSLPMSRKKQTVSDFNTGRFNLAVELGQRGTLANHPMREMYSRIRFGITINEIWFMRREVD